MSELLHELRRNGIALNNIVTDGKIHRFKIHSGAKKENGWYIAAHRTLTNGDRLEIITVGDWTSGEKKTFLSKNDLSTVESLRIKDEIKQLIKDGEKEKKKKNDRAAQIAQRMIKSGGLVQSHPYLEKKKILPNGSGIVAMGEKILIPIVNEQGTVRSFQAILPNSEKRFLSGSEVSGNFTIIPAKTPGEKFGIICEGYATGMSLYEAFEEKYDVIVSFFASNMPIVAKKMIKIYGKENLLAACDDDRFNGKNAGRDAGTQCEKLGIKAVYPMKTQEYEAARGTDFNDLYIIHGLNKIVESFKEPKRRAEFQAEPDYEQDGFYREVETKTGARFVPQYLDMAEWCFAKKNLCYDDTTSLKFDGKKWLWMSKTELNNFVIEMNRYHIQPHHIDNFTKMIRGKCFEKALNIKTPEGLINVNNGILDVKSGTLLPHSYEWMFKYCAPVDYSPTAQCPMWENFLVEVFEKNIELIDLAQRLFGYIIIGGKPFLHRAFVLYGHGRNGKSTFLDILRAVVGLDSYSVVSMSKLDKPFSIVNIDGKLANIVEETPSEEINAEIFKTMVAGGEVQAAHKGFDEYSFRCQARFVFACNEMPIFRDRTVGLEERLVFIPFNRFFKEGERDPDMTDKLLTELPGILLWAVEGARLILNSRSLPKYETTEDSKTLYRRETNPLYAWFADEVTVLNGGPKITVREVYDRYKQDCEENGNHPFSKDKFIKQFRMLLTEKCNAESVVYDPKKKSTDRLERVFDCFKWTDRRDSEDGSKNSVSHKNMSLNGYLDT